jgi:hypothetical protein
MASYLDPAMLTAEDPDWQASRDYAADQQRHCCSNADCSALCVGDYCSDACRAHDDAVLQDMATCWEVHMLTAGARPVTTHYADTTGRVLLGARQLADAQYATDEAQGGLVAMACGYGR